MESSSTVLQQQFGLEGTWVLEKCIKSPFQTNPEGITLATVFTAACALIFAKETGSKDLVFGRVVSGRQCLPVNSQHIVGPCTNAVPVRVGVNGGTNPRGLLCKVQYQYLESLPYETIGLGGIKENCTDWSDATLNYNFYTVFQNFDMSPESRI
ncbi:hypothetical protein LZ30DRAFT_685835 [Colletotrichum cereale]|nr:hypothetical protein LZ30DRAFT_685835 [Colletotrichum cereale]